MKVLSWNLQYIPRRYMVEILPIRRQTLSNQSVNQYIPNFCEMVSFNQIEYTSALKCATFLFNITPPPPPGE